MQQTAPGAPQQTTSGRPALRYGSLFGLGLAVLLIAHAFFRQATGFGGGAVVTFVAALAAYFFAGILAARQTGKVSTGLVAGLFVGLISSLLDGIVTFILFIGDSARIDRLVAQAQARVDQQGGNFHFTRGLLIAFTAGGIALVVVIALLIGLGVGAIGGAVGKNRASLPANPYQEGMYQGMPPGAAYPPPGGYMPPPPMPGGWPQSQPQAPTPEGWPQNPPPPPGQ